MASVETLIKDPEFLSLDVVSKRQVLESSDPEFKGLDEDSKTQVISSISTIGLSRPATDVGGIPGVQLPREEARDVAAQRMVARARAAGQTDLLTRDEANALAKQAGIPGLPEDVHVVSTNDVNSPFIRNLLSIKEIAGTAGLGIGPAIQKVVEDVSMNEAQKQLLGQTALRERVPESEPLGQIIGSLVPLGGGAAAISQAPTLLRQIAAGAGAGLKYGTTIGAANQLAKTGLDTTAPELVKSTLAGAGGGLALGTAAPLTVKSLDATIRGIIATPGALKRSPAAIKEIITKVENRLAPPSLEQSAKAVLDFSKEETAKHLPIVTQRIEENLGAIPSDITAEQALDIAKRTKNMLYEQRLVDNEQAAAQGLVTKGDRALSDAKAALDKIATVTPKKKERIYQSLEAIYKGDKTPQQGQTIQEQLNDDFADQYRNGSFSKSDPLTQAKLAIRDSFANQMDEIHQAVTGKNDTPYSDIGSLIEFTGRLENKLESVFGAESARKTGLKPRQTGIPVTRFETARQIGRKVLTPFQKSEMERLDQQVQKIFKQGERQPISSLLSQEEINVLQSKLQPNTPLSLNEQIDQLVSTYPASIKNNPVLAKKIAEAELAGQSSPLAP